MTTVTEAPPYGSVETYAAIFRRVIRRAEYLPSAALGVIQALVGDPQVEDAVKVVRIGNIAAAADLVDDEMSDRDNELERLRARVAELEAKDAHGFSREADDPTPVSPARVPLHTGAVTDEGLVDESGAR
jgi:hypothetical protein